MVVKRISVVVLICFLSFAESVKRCDPTKDAEPAKVCGDKELCIIIDDNLVTSYNYSKKMNITVECHYTEWWNSIMDHHFTLYWKKGHDVKTEGECIRNLKHVIHLSPDTNETVYTCETHSENKMEPKNATENIKFLYVPEETDTKDDKKLVSTSLTDTDDLPVTVPNDTNKKNQTTEENLTTNQQLKLFFESNWIVLATGFVLFIVVIVVIVATCVVLKLRKRPEEDRRCLNPKGSRESLGDIPKHHKDTRSEPELNEHYTDLRADTHSTISEVYSDPYTAMYTQPIPKNVRNPKVLPTLPPKPKTRNIENYSNTCGLVYEDPSSNNNIASNTRRIYNNVARDTGSTNNKMDKSSKNTGATYNTIGKSLKSTGATYNTIDKSLKNTGATYNNFGKSSKNTGITYNNTDKRSKNTQCVNFYDNMAASYSNTGNEIYSSDVYSEPGLYEEPS